MNISFSSPLKFDRQNQNKQNIQFKAVPQGIKKDVVELSKKTAEGIKEAVKLHIPGLNKPVTFPIDFDLSKAQTVSRTVIHPSLGTEAVHTIKFNPENTVTVTEKIRSAKTGAVVREVPKEVYVIESVADDYNKVYHLVTKDFSEEVGYLLIEDYRSVKGSPYLKSNLALRRRPKLGIDGDIINTTHTQNNFPKKYAGVGIATDKIAVDYAVKQGIDSPTITSYADGDSLAARYKEGKRFVLDKFNKLMEERLAKYGKKRFSTNDFGMTIMYLPKEKAEQYAREVKQSPVFHD